MAREPRLDDLTTEGTNPRSRDLDRLSTEDMLRVINAEDATVAAAVAEVIPKIAIVVEKGAASVKAGGKIHLLGAGTSGRLAAS